MEQQQSTRRRRRRRMKRLTNLMSYRQQSSASSLISGRVDGGATIDLIPLRDSIMGLSALETAFVPPLMPAAMPAALEATLTLPMTQSAPALKRGCGGLGVEMSGSHKRPGSFWGGSCTDSLPGDNPVAVALLGPTAFRKLTRGVKVDCFAAVTSNSWLDCATNGVVRFDPVDNSIVIYPRGGGGPSPLSAGGSAWTLPIHDVYELNSDRGLIAALVRGVVPPVVFRGNQCLPYTAAAMTASSQFVVPPQEVCRKEDVRVHRFRKRMHHFVLINCMCSVPLVVAFRNHQDLDKFIDLVLFLQSYHGITLATVVESNHRQSQTRSSYGHREYQTPSIVRQSAAFAGRPANAACEPNTQRRFSSSPALGGGRLSSFRVALNGLFHCCRPTMRWVSRQRRRFFYPEYVA